MFAAAATTSMLRCRCFAAGAITYYVADAARRDMFTMLLMFEAIDARYFIATRALRRCYEG